MSILYYRLLTVDPPYMRVPVREFRATQTKFGSFINLRNSIGMERIENSLNNIHRISIFSLYLCSST